MADMPKLTGPEIADAELTGWVYLLGGLQTRIATGDFATGLAVVNAIGAAAEEMDHHPDLDLRYDHLDVRLTSHDSGGVTERDVRLARTVGELAGRTGVSLSCAGLSRVELAMDTPDHRRLVPFWRAVLAVDAPADGPDDEVRDPGGAFPTVWFQESGSEEPRQRWHPDVWVDPADVRPRIDAALAAGGTLVSDEEAPSFWVLADPEGNRICLCTWENRG